MIEKLYTVVMVCTTESVDCQPGFGAIEILIVSVIVLSLIGIALTLLCCLCRTYSGDNSAEDSCFQDIENVDEVGVGHKASSAICGLGGYCVGGGGAGGGGAGVADVGRVAGRLRGAGHPFSRKAWDEVGVESGNLDHLPSRNHARYVADGRRPNVGVNDDPKSGAWQRFGDSSDRGSKSKFLLRRSCESYLDLVHFQDDFYLALSK